MSKSNSTKGSCHCGNIEFQLQLTQAIETYTARACQCSFCRKHNATYISDPQGSLSIQVKQKSELSRYRFASGVVDFLVCKSCGVIPCVTREIEGNLYGVVNIHTLQDSKALDLVVAPMDYDGEAESAKEQRHQNNWIADTSIEIKQ